MKNLIYTIKLKFSRFLYNQLDKILNYEESLNSLESNYKRDIKKLEEITENISQTNKIIQKNFNISGDIHDIQHHRNWAVISVKGENNYVKFIDMNRADIRELQSFLKRFEYSNKTIDEPFGMNLFKYNNDWR